ncbi:MAG: sel1 repeat family protein [Alphaproteobacteria bacterium]|nr:sel1 repeat family protein [Alphaproteobacteria bacterium]
MISPTYGMRPDEGEFKYSQEPSIEKRIMRKKQNNQITERQNINVHVTQEEPEAHVCLVPVGKCAIPTEKRNFLTYILGKSEAFCSYVTHEPEYDPVTIRNIINKVLKKEEPCLGRNPYLMDTKYENRDYSSEDEIYVIDKKLQDDINRQIHQKTIEEEHQKKNKSPVSINNKGENIKLNTSSEKLENKQICVRNSTSSLQNVQTVEPTESPLRLGKNASDESVDIDNAGRLGSEKQYQIGCRYYNGVGTDINYEEAFKYYKKAADQSHANAQYMVGSMYYGGTGTCPNNKEAFKYYKNAADQNHADAQYMVGSMYDDGIGTSKNNKESLQYYKEAADQDHTEAQFHVGLFYSTCDDEKKNYLEAFKYYKKAADQNHTEAQFNLGILYANGQGTEKNYFKALECFKKQSKDDPEAQINIGMLYKFGLGVIQDYGKAMEYFQKAANRGHADAKFFIGGLYYEGQGTKQDYFEARKWFWQAEAQNHEGAKDYLRRIQGLPLIGYSLRLMCKPPVRDEIKLGKVVVFSEDDRIYYQFNNADKFEISRAKFSNDLAGYSDSFDRILRMLNGDIANIDRYNIALQQEEERKHGLAIHNYELAFNITEDDTARLLNFILLHGHAPQIDEKYLKNLGELK